VVKETATEVVVTDVLIALIVGAVVSGGVPLP
jgi:hypothetical protein